MKNRILIVGLILWSLSWQSGCGNIKNKLSSDETTKEELAKTEKLLIVPKLIENNHLRVEERVSLFYRLKNENPQGYDFENEDQLNMYGYSLLWENKIHEAIAIFKLIVSEFPTSANAYDSLGEAYLANGDKKLSLFNYERSLELNPDNFGAEDQIERIKFPNKKRETPAEKFVKVFTPTEYIEDLDQLGRKLIEVNPSALKFISSIDFWKIIEEKKSLITDQTTYGEFSWHCNEIIASINCSHTSKGGFFPEHNMLPTNLRFPLQTRWIKDQLFVINPLNNGDKVALKDEIVKINGKAVAEIIQDIYKHIPSQGYIETTKNHYFNRWVTGLIPYALSFPKNYSIEVKGKSNSIALNPAESTQDPLRDPSIKNCGDNLCLSYPKNSTTAVLTLASFNYYRWNNLQVFEEFMDKSFKEIQEKGIKNLIIDVRGNGGGSPESSIYLLRYLADKPFVYFTSTDYSEGEGIQEPFANHFKGNLYYIMDGEGNSTTGHFMSMVKDLQLGTIVGEELGSNQFCTGGQNTCRLTHTKMEFYVGSSSNRTSVTSLPDETGILPDHYFTQSIEDYLEKVDAVMEYTLSLIDK